MENASRLLRAVDVYRRIYRFAGGRYYRNVARVVDAPCVDADIRKHSGPPGSPRAHGGPVPERPT